MNAAHRGRVRGGKKSDVALMILQSEFSRYCYLSSVDEDKECGTVGIHIQDPCKEIMIFCSIPYLAEVSWKNDKLKVNKTRDEISDEAGRIYRAALTYALSKTESSTAAASVQQEGASA